MDLFNETGYIPSPSITLYGLLTRHPSLQIANLLAQPCCVCSQQSSTASRYTSVWSSDGSCVSCCGYHEEVFSEDTSVDSQDVTFQHSEFTFLNDVSETANPSHTIEAYTWVTEPSTTTCERVTGTSEMGHADVTEGEKSETFERSSWSTPELSATATGNNEQNDGDDDEKDNADNKGYKGDKQEEDVEGDDSGGDVETEESAVLIRAPQLRESLTAFYVLLMMWLYFEM